MSREQTYTGTQETTARQTDAGRLEKKADVKNSIVRISFAGLALIVELVWIVAVLTRLGEKASWFSGAERILTMLIVLVILGKRTNAGFKMPWIILITAMPMLGMVLYFFFGRYGTTRGVRKRFEEIDRLLMPYLKQDEDVERAFENAAGMKRNVGIYLRAGAGFPVYGNTEVVYYPDAAEALEAQLEALREAKRFVFMEYHAIEDSEAFGRIRDVLAQKAREGVEVRLFYDDVGSIGFINRDFISRMEALGIRTRVFNPVMPFLLIFMNNRDHRKITVIDGKTAFTGGYNLANEYFHITEPYGFWKDSGIRLRGDAVRSMTVLFLEMWNAINKSDIDDERFDAYLPAQAGEDRKTEGFVQPYADSPLDNEPVGENVYLGLADAAERYVYYATPYLILTDEMIRGLVNAAKRGVDVRIFTPGIPDKKLTYQITRSNYGALADAGVRIFEFTPGFLHAKMCVTDDEAATVGTINMDYRSLYLHFENGAVIYKVPAIRKIREDFEAIEEVSEEVTCRYTGMGRMIRIGQCALRLIAPLM